MYQVDMSPNNSNITVYCWLPLCSPNSTVLRAVQLPTVPSLLASRTNADRLLGSHFPRHRGRASDAGLRHHAVSASQLLSIAQALGTQLFI